MRFVSFMVVSYAATLFVVMHGNAPSHKRLLSRHLADQTQAPIFRKVYPPISQFSVSFNLSLVYVAVQRGMTMD